MHELNVLFIFNVPEIQIRVVDNTLDYQSTDRKISSLSDETLNQNPVSI